MFKTSLILFSLYLIAPTVVAGDSRLDWQDLFTDIPSISKTEMEVRGHELLMVDVRSKFDFDQKHLDGIRHVPFSSRMFMLEMESLREANKDKTIVVYCDTDNCIKSYRAVAKCQQEKIENVVIFDLHKDMQESSQDKMFSSL